MEMKQSRRRGQRTEFFCSLVSEQDGLPNQVCVNCAYHVDKYLEFKEQCQASDWKLRQRVTSADQEQEIIVIKEEADLKDAHDLTSYRRPRRPMLTRTSDVDVPTLQDVPSVRSLDHNESKLCCQTDDVTRFSWRHRNFLTCVNVGVCPDDQVRDHYCLDRKTDHVVNNFETRLIITTTVRIEGWSDRHSHSEGASVRAIHPTEIQTSISPSSAVELYTTSALANYATEPDYKELSDNESNASTVVVGNLNVALHQDLDEAATLVHDFPLEQKDPLHLISFPPWIQEDSKPTMSSENNDDQPVASAQSIQVSASIEINEESLLGTPITICKEKLESELHTDYVEGEEASKVINGEDSVSTKEIDAARYHQYKTSIDKVLEMLEDSSPSILSLADSLSHTNSSVSQDKKLNMTDGSYKNHNKHLHSDIGSSSDSKIDFKQSDNITAIFSVAIPLPLSKTATQLSESQTTQGAMMAGNYRYGKKTKATQTTCKRKGSAENPKRASRKRKKLALNLTPIAPETNFISACKTIKTQTNFRNISKLAKTCNLITPSLRMTNNSLNTSEIESDANIWFNIESLYYDPKKHKYSSSAGELRSVYNSSGAFSKSKSSNTPQVINAKENDNDKNKEVFENTKDPLNTSERELSDNIVVESLVHRTEIKDKDVLICNKLLEETNLAEMRTSNKNKPAENQTLLDMIKPSNKSSLEMSVQKRMSTQNIKDNQSGGKHLTERRLSQGGKAGEKENKSERRTSTEEKIANKENKTERRKSTEGKMEDKENKTERRKSTEGKIADKENKTERRKSTEGKIADKENKTERRKSTEGKIADKENKTERRKSTEGKIADKEMSCLFKFVVRAVASCELCLPANTPRPVPRNTTGCPTANSLKVFQHCLKACRPDSGWGTRARLSGPPKGPAD
uniref:ZAD domain-containing protein n=1 Tax=Timema monikensis TaxID=170555 RepID=A0A7R9EFT6_9NEOP|nr:unnamed protein product [Timema monikensis]